MNRTYWKVDPEKLAGADSSDNPIEDGRTRVHEEDANLVGSLLEGFVDKYGVSSPERHAPVIDLDVPHTLVPSTTEGHGHLYIDVEMTWKQYKAILRALYKGGVIERGFYKLSIARRGSFVRKPGVLKSGAQPRHASCVNGYCAAADPEWWRDC